MEERFSVQNIRTAIALMSDVQAKVVLNYLIPVEVEDMENIVLDLSREELRYNAIFIGEQYQESLAAALYHEWQHIPAPVRDRKYQLVLSRSNNAKDIALNSGVIPKVLTMEEAMSMSPPVKELKNKLRATPALPYEVKPVNVVEYKSLLSYLTGVFQLEKHFQLLDTMNESFHLYAITDNEKNRNFFKRPTMRAIYEEVKKTGQCHCVDLRYVLLGLAANNDIAYGDYLLKITC